MKGILTILLTCLSYHLAAQNIFPVLVDNCQYQTFCLDCGDIKADLDKNEFSNLLDRLSKAHDLQDLEGEIQFQVLVDSSGRSCVISHTDESKYPISTALVEGINKLSHWQAAASKSVKEDYVSVIVAVHINNGKLSGEVIRLDMDAFKKAFDKPTDPENYNNSYHYKNEHLSNYTITTWNSDNSSLPDNMADHISIDTAGLVWVGVDNGLVTFDGKEFKDAGQNITDKGNYFSYYALATDNNNVKWACGKDGIYSFDNKKWRKYDSADIGFRYTYSIVNNPKTSEIFFCAEEGLVILKNRQWSHINSMTKTLPSSRVSFARRDSRGRLWIGTYSGSVMIDEKGKVTNFEEGKGVLKEKCITSMDEDEQGNLYFTLYDLDPENENSSNRNGGLAIRYIDGTFKHFTTSNSGLPVNYLNSVLYDSKEKVLWISSTIAGLIRYDLKNTWENYHNKNSAIPTSYVSEMQFDKNGNLYLATRQGLVKLGKK